MSNNDIYNLNFIDFIISKIGGLIGSIIVIPIAIIYMLFVHFVLKKEPFKID